MARLKRSLEARDGAQAIGDMKCVVESIARIVHEIDGAPAGSDDSFQKVVSAASKLLKNQPGDHLADTTPFGDMANQAGKIAVHLATIRNQYGGGHGRPRTPDLRDEMVVLALDGGLLWSKWALRRLGYFSEGRPQPLIDALIGPEQQIFHSGVLARRLRSANLAIAEAHHQRAIGVAVGQRAARQTIVVRQDGMYACQESDDTTIWPRDYRIGLVDGLWFSIDGKLTMTPESALDGVKILEPLADCSEELARLVGRLPSESVNEFDPDTHEAAQAIRARIPSRPHPEAAPLNALADFVSPYPF
ncbi:Uncharacterised protein [Mycobacteroides abscessus]|uniref:Abortive infection protein-like C-terminal domain-containing protein n=1 Tax=Mycobacteroides abscessus subsp. abscessus TaxID=1185650 RepID=A0AB38D4Q7_9MYCO|nr:abortive infection family protein [Mycobacteroides abscessus]MBE5420156.1 hypothetical protein [Mycobacteroides abscessus]MBE5455145.1 hypothetical protein [Mycobacteroides abscessus]MBN7296744.1 abortive infection family protein [Mycobacteroides abscessus subsp. abscessus]MBN7463162.1 abortive infection family protein [Mycobacteroides abscessus subsp. abscessus]CPR79536.1 Uncharacterised protein [Mycobacteroides abscessus]